MTAHKPSPGEAQSELIEEYLNRYARSWNVIELATEFTGDYVDIEILFSTDPDIGVSIHLGTGQVDVCLLVNDDDEQWLEEAQSAIDLGLLRNDSDTALKPLATAIMAARHIGKGHS